MDACYIMVILHRLRVGRVEPRPELQQAVWKRSVETQKTGCLPRPLLQPGQLWARVLEGGALQ